MSLRHHEIAESRHRILNPITEEKLMLLGDICRLELGQRQLDLACGKGEMLTRWAQKYGTGGVGVDLSEVFLTAARERAAELGVSERVSFERGDAGAYKAEPGAYDVASCIGATWIGGGLAGTIDLLRPALRPGGLMLIGEPYWTEPPPGRGRHARLPRPRPPRASGVEPPLCGLGRVRAARGRLSARTYRPSCEETENLTHVHLPGAVYRR
ncbi:class I SAM-dependent methyltransferase [Streptomyces sp. NBC_00433]